VRSNALKATTVVERRQKGVAESTALRQPVKETTPRRRRKAADERQEGNGAGDGERLHGRSKALRGNPMSGSGTK
jgi:hypothetical protein